MVSGLRRANKNNNNNNNYYYYWWSKSTSTMTTNTTTTTTKRRTWLAVVVVVALLSSFYYSMLFIISTNETTPPSSSSSSPDVAVFRRSALMMMINASSSSSSSSSSRNNNNNNNNNNGLKMELRHVDSGKNMSKYERVQRAIKRGRERLEKLMIISSNSMQITQTEVEAEAEAPLNVGSGEFLMRLSIGTPPKPYYAIMDTGSDLIWTQCEPCIHCYSDNSDSKMMVTFDPSKSSSYSALRCNSPLCSALPISICSDDQDICGYEYQYGDYSSTQGVLATETFTFFSNNNNNSLLLLAFGCGNDNEGSGFQGAGLVGLGRGPLSLISQMDVPRFSYCLNPLDDKTSTLIMLINHQQEEEEEEEEKEEEGEDEDKEDNIVSNNTNDTLLMSATTLLVSNPSQPSFYYLNLHGISLGSTRLPNITASTFAINPEDGSGGMIIDSGTTVTFLPQQAYDILKKELISTLNNLHQYKPSASSNYKGGGDGEGDGDGEDGDAYGDVGLDLCFDITSPSPSPSPSHHHHLSTSTFLLWSSISKEGLMSTYQGIIT